MSRGALLAWPLLLLVGCDDMTSQPVLEGDRAVAELPGGTSTQPPIPGTVALGALPPAEAARAPERWTGARLLRGRDRYETFCTPCHGVQGDGDGIVVARGFPRPPSLHEERLREAPDRHLYEIVTHGVGDMYPFAGKLDLADRWAVVGYLRALQLARHAPAERLEAQDLEELGPQ